MRETIEKPETETAEADSSLSAGSGSPAALPLHGNRDFLGFVFAMVLLMATVSLAIFLNHLKIEEGSNIAPTRRIQDLVSLLTQAQARQESLENELAQLQKRYNSLEAESSQASISERATKDISEDPEYRKLLRQAGLTEMRGKGIMVVLEDAPAGKKPAGPSPQGNRVQSEDLLKLVNDLRAAGAKAISVNGQRLVATSAIVNAGPALMVNQTRISSPIEIRALGEPETLRSSLQIRGGILEYLNFFGIRVNVEERANLEIPAYQLANY